jgi:hypothetical protein
MDDMEGLHPGCMVASVAYQERMFDVELKQMNVDYILRMRSRFRDWLSEVSDKYPPPGDVDLDALADNLTAIIEGAIILSRSLRDQSLIGRQTRLFRNHVKLIFGA